MRCYFLRHGLAGDRDQWEGDDFERPLTEEGRERMAREARSIAALELELDLIVTSPLVRAKQTAEIVAQRLNMAERVFEDARVGLEFDVTRLTGVLREHSDSASMMLVGHEPSMSHTIGQLIGGGRIELKKGALACVDVPDSALLYGELIWLMPPRMLALSKRR